MMANHCASVMPTMRATFWSCLSTCWYSVNASFTATAARHNSPETVPCPTASQTRCARVSSVSTTRHTDEQYRLPPREAIEPLNQLSGAGTIATRIHPTGLSATTDLITVTTNQARRKPMKVPTGQNQSPQPPVGRRDQAPQKSMRSVPQHPHPVRRSTDIPGSHQTTIYVGDTITDLCPPRETDPSTYVGDESYTP